MTQKRLPDFFVVGHPKCGTSALFQMLSRHPQIHMPVKEPRFFTPSSPGKKASAKRPDTLEGYLSLFADATPEQRIGEATPSYLMSGSAASRIAALQPDARIIAILREPASYLRSFHLHAVQNHHEPERDLRKAIGLDLVRRRAEGDPRGAWQDGLVDSRHVRYVEQLSRYHAVFPREQVLVLIYEDFRADNEATVRRVLRFLEVDDTHPVETIEANTTVRVRSPLNDLARSASLGRSPASRAVKSAVKAIAPKPVRRNVLTTIRRGSVRGAPAPADETLMRELRERFKADVVALSGYLNRDLVTFWGYDDVS